jgi:hypothetical protein
MTHYLTPGGRLRVGVKPVEFVRQALLPYGMWRCADGRELLYNRFYEPIWQRTGGTVTAADPKEHVLSIIHRSWFYEDRTVDKRSAGLAALAAWGLPAEPASAAAPYRIRARGHDAIDALRRAQPSSPPRGYVASWGSIS